MPHETDNLACICPIYAWISKGQLIRKKYTLFHWIWAWMAGHIKQKIFNYLLTDYLWTDYPMTDYLRTDYPARLNFKSIRLHNSQTSKNIFQQKIYKRMCFAFLKFYMLEPVSKCSILFEIKEGENFNHRNTYSISRIKIWAWNRYRTKGDVLKLAHCNIHEE